ncbi:glycosyltransferase [Stakelama tenebrarum]|uniref:Glycosyltransferase family 4 protein n=1 Tax=Stakelama tenebrarum TaxID=2711215 RepID=A0A6G6Y3S1_9SPHN|nr:glycosyltransferase [Sphingosinithalassobacter tenebrarum]QIG79550.1 glycosyltransferase family 4 protein [Sphingosinithalassobacter tenebrarum]
MKTLHIAQILKGGTASHLCEVLPHQIARHGVENVRVLAPADQIGYLDILPSETIRTFPTAQRSPRALMDFTLAARRAIRRERPDIVHLHGTFAGTFVRLSYRLWPAPRPPIVYCSHGWAFNMRVSQRKRALYARTERMLAGLADRILCISRFELESACKRGIARDRLTLVYNGIADQPPHAPTAPRDATEPEVRLVFVGRDDDQKGFDTLCAAMARIADAPVRLDAIGPDRSDRQSPNIVRHGWLTRETVAAFLAEADAMVVPSRWEGFGLVAAEAMRQGLAVIASDVDALPELVEEGVTGRLFPADDPARLAEILRELDRETLARMGRAGRERFLRDFTADRMNAQIDGIYAQLLAG